MVKQGGRSTAWNGKVRIVGNRSDDTHVSTRKSGVNVIPVHHVSRTTCSLTASSCTKTRFCRVLTINVQGEWTEMDERLRQKGDV